MIPSELFCLRAEETYPSEATRAELSEKLDLSDRQLQMWFCHRRLKDKKDGQVKKTPKPAPVQPASAVPALSLPAAELDSGSDSGSGSGSGCSPYSEPRREFASGSSNSRAEYETMGSAGYEQPPPRSSVMVRRAVACIEAQLGEPLRDDGPTLGMEFDPLPPGAFGTPIGMKLLRYHWSLVALMVPTLNFLSLFVVVDKLL